MVDIDDVRARTDLYRKAAQAKNLKVSIDDFLTLDSEYLAAKRAFEELRAQQNAHSKDIGVLNGVERANKLSALKELSIRVKAAEEQLFALDQRWSEAQLDLPALPLDKVPYGKSDADNVESRRVGELPKFTFKARSHVEIAQELGLADFARAATIAGTRTYFLRGDGARLQHAVLSFAMDMIRKRGYVLFDPPHIVRRAAMVGTGYFPGGEEQAYHLDARDDHYHLIGTAEVPVAALHGGEILHEDQLPLRYAGYSPCYRREAGTYGKDTAGFYRVHQFYKVEQVVVCRNDAAESASFHVELLANAEDFLKELKLPYRIVDVCTGDMGQGQAFKNDIETWMPSRNAYCETHSCSTFHDFQARRLQLRYRDRTGKVHFAHTLNNTLVASPRILIPILEIYQNADGSVTIPDALRSYMGGQEKIVKT